MCSGNIIEDIRKNRTTGADRLVSEYKGRLYKVAYGICGDEHEAEDLVFRTFEQVIEKKGIYRNLVVLAGEGAKVSNVAIDYARAYQTKLCIFREGLIK